MNNDILIICESVYNGNTLKLATAMANELNCLLVNTTQAGNLDLKKYKTIGFGSGIFFARHNSMLMEFISKLEFFNQPAFIFSTHGSPILGKYHNPLKMLLTEKGRTIIGEFSTKGYDCTGCGKCLKSCLLGIFELQYDKAVPIRELDCVQCRLCQSYCKSRAIYLHGTWKDSIRVAKRHAKR